VATEIPFTSAVVQRIHGIANTPLPTDTLRLAKQCVLDWIAVALAAMDDPLVEIVHAQALEEGGNSQATMLGQSQRLSIRQAALVNGAMGHALDYDDVHLALPGHITAAVLPAALAVAEAENRGGAELLQAFVAGYEAAAMIGIYVGQAHYQRGFHATGTVGAFGAAAACALLMGLDRDATARAFGIVGTQTAGLKSQFGTMCKPLHAGKASENGVYAAQLARRGFTSRIDIIECLQGFADTQSPERHHAAALAPPRRGYHLHDNLFKYSAACYATHGAIEAARQLRSSHTLQPEHIDQVDVQVEASVDRICNIPKPRTGLEAKFSLRLTTALSLAGEDTSDPALFSDATARRADLVSLRDRIIVGFAADTPLLLTDVMVRTTNGQTLRARHDASVPLDDLDEQGARLERKFQNLVTPSHGAEHATTILANLARLEDEKSLNALTALLRVAPTLD
jgi:2-methylcitrate dehydratase PrpD